MIMKGVEGVSKAASAASYSIVLSGTVTEWLAEIASCGQMKMSSQHAVCTRGVRGELYLHVSKIPLPYEMRSSRYRDCSIRDTKASKNVHLRASPASATMLFLKSLALH